MKRFIGIDPSTKTGFVAINEQGKVLEATEITSNEKDPQRIHEIIQKVHLKLIEHNTISGAFVAIEDFAFAQGQRMALMGGIGWGIRIKLYLLGIPYLVVGTGQLKKFATGKGKGIPKNVIMREVYKRWGFESNSDNIVDAYVLAQIGRYAYQGIEGTKFQQEVLKKIG